jgi:hypothetical protein
MADQPAAVAATLTLMQVRAWDSSQHALHSVGTAALFLLSFTAFFPSHFIDRTQVQQVAAVL